jgi:hypothetical protein
MNELVFFALGFSLAILLISRVSLRPQAKKVLKRLGLISHHKATAPKQKHSENDDWVSTTETMVREISPRIHKAKTPGKARGEEYEDYDS